MIDLWLISVEKGQFSAALFLDLSAGFDVIPHSILLKKLRLYKFDDNTIKWFKSYLNDRFQCVQVESCFSPFLSVPWGVPRGSILGPLLFVIFILELPDVLNKNAEHDIAAEINLDNENDTENESHVIVYADDNTPTTANEDPYILKDNIESDAKNVTDWFFKNEMVTSGDKTKLLIMGTQSNRLRKLESQNIKINITVCQESVEESSSERLLGLTVNNTLTWKNHLFGNDDNLGLFKELSQRIGILKKLRKYIPDVHFKKIVCGIFTSKMIYCITVWGKIWNLSKYEDTNYRSSSMTKNELQKLQVLQNKSMRLISGLSYETPTAILLETCNQLSVHQLIAYHTACQVYKIYTTKLPVYHYNRLFYEENERLNGADTRASEIKSKNIQFDLSLARGSFFYQGSRIWSLLPPHIKKSDKLEKFKPCCRKWILQNIEIRP